MSTLHHRALARTSAASPLAPRASFMARLHTMWLAHRTRRLLAAMDDRQLADIGLGRGDAMVEAARPMWDVQR